MSEIRQAREALVTRILEGAGKASSSERRAAFNNSGLTGTLGALVDKVASMLIGSPTRTSTPRRRRASVKTTSSRSWYALRSGKPLGSTTQHFPPLRRRLGRNEHAASSLDTGHGFGTKALFALIRTVSRQPVLDVIKLVKYRADFYGGPMQGVTHEAMRGPSAGLW